MNKDQEEELLLKKRQKVMVQQALNAGFDLDTVEGQNKYRRVLEFMSMLHTRCVKINGELTRYGVMFIFIGALSLMAYGAWHKAGEWALKVLK